MAPHKGTETALLKEKIRSKALLEQILRENGPDPTAGVTDAALESKIPETVRVIDRFPSEGELSGRLGAAGCGRALPEIGVDPALEKPILRLSPDVRKHLTFTRLLKRFRFPQEPEESAR